MKVIGIDPGQTTGFVQLEADTQDHSIRAVVLAREYAWEERFDLIPLINHLEPTDVVVLESFNLHPHQFKHQVGSAFPSVRIIGIVEAALHIYSPQTAMILVPPTTKKYIKILDEHPLPSSEHIRDAYRLARYWLINNMRT